LPSSHIIGCNILYYGRDRVMEIPARTMHSKQTKEKVSN
jgi:hypothetical protein